MAQAYMGLFDHAVAFIGRSYSMYHVRCILADRIRCIMFLSFSLFSFLVFFLTDVFQSEMWKEFSSVIPSHLHPIASEVQKTVLSSKADSTVRKYLGGLKRWKQWAASNGISHIPANPFQVAVYLQCLLNEANSPSPIRTAV